MAEGDGNVLYQTARVTLCRLTSEHRSEFVQLANVSTEFLRPWVRLPVSLAEFDEYLDRFDGQAAECTLICLKESGRIAGTASLSNIIRGPYQRATVGYNAFAPTARRGYMSEGFPLVCRFAFEELGLHRLEADIQPDNGPSLQFAKRVGLRREGYSPAYAYVNGDWRDHERWAVSATASDVPGAGQRGDIPRRGD